MLTPDTPGLTRFVRLTLLMLGLVAAVAPATPTPSAPVPSGVAAGRQAENVVIITIRGEIDRYTALSVVRRLKIAEASGADAVVIDLDTPGGEVVSVLEITQAIKGTTVPRTVAWINPTAYSGGAIIAVACEEIVVNDPARFGDALIIQAGPTGAEALPEELRPKFLSPLLADTVDSARRNGYDEYLVQAFVTLGLELWLVRDTETGRTMAINEAEYRMLFEGEPPRSSPIAPSIGRNVLADRDFARNAEGVTDEAVDPTKGADPLATPPPPAETVSGGAQLPPIEEGDRAFRPAGPSVEDLSGTVDLELDEPTRRPAISEGDRGRYELVGYIQDGNGPLIVTTENAELLGFGPGVVLDDDELRQHLGASNLRRLDRSWSESFARFMTILPVRGLLIVVFIIGLFLELTSPGLGLPGGLAAVALFGLLAPPMLIGMANWWEIAAIAVGIAFIGVELFLLPGFGVFGVLGMIALFGGLVGTFVREDPGGLFPGTEGAKRDLLYGVVTLLMSLVTSGIGIYFLSKNVESLPLFRKLILQNPEPGDNDTMLEAMSGPVATLRVGDEGVTTIPLRPSGRMSTGDGATEEIHDVVADMGWIEAGVRVRVIEIDGFRVTVEPADGEAGPDVHEGDA
ncbi:MAG: ATP-dependent Clp protease proteolytic subunit [Planctomycetota bacterium]